MALGKRPLLFLNRLYTNVGFRGKGSYLWLLCIIAFIEFFVFKDYLLLRKAYFFKGAASDTLNYNYPFASAVADYMGKYGIPKWSFRFGMGQSLFPFFLHDPFDIFIYMAGKDHILYGMVYKEAIKILLGGLVFFQYLKTVRLSDFTALAGSLFFSFCSFMIIGSCWYIFSFEALNMAILLLAFEQLYTRRQWYLFPVAILLIAISQPFNLYLYGVFLIAYAVLRHVQTHGDGHDITRTFFRQIPGYGIMGLLLSAPLLMENIAKLLESPRVNGANSQVHILSSAPLLAMPDKMKLGTCILRFFSGNILGDGAHFNGYGNFLEAPMFYCGLPCLLLMPQVFMFLQRKAKIVFLVMMIIWVIPVIFPYFRYAFWLFTGDYYRAYSFFVAFFFMYYSLLALASMRRERKINIAVLIITVAVLFALLNFPYFTDKSRLNFPDRPALDHTVYLFVSIMIPVYALLLYFMARQKTSVSAGVIFVAVVVAELVFSASGAVNNMEALTATDIHNGKIYNDQTIAALNYIKSRDSSFYRIDKTYSSSPARFMSRNDGMAQGYNGTSMYSSFNQEYYIRYLQLMGIADRAYEYQSRWVVGLVGYPVLEAEGQVKYMLCKDEPELREKTGYDLLAIAGDVKIFRNRYVLPFGYTYSYYIREDDFKGLSNRQKELVSLCACVLNDNDMGKTAGLKEFRLADTFAAETFDDKMYAQQVAGLNKDHLVLSKCDETLVAGKITASENKVMYFSIPYDKGWTLRVDGNVQDKLILSAGMTGVMLTSGAHAIEMQYNLRFLGKGVALCILGLLLYVALWMRDIRGKRNKYAG